MYNSNTQTIVAPVEMIDIADALQEDSLDLGTLCESSNINKWALRKPMRHTSKDRLTEEQVISLKCGLAPVMLTKLLQNVIGNDALGSNTEVDCLNEIGEWSYHQPRGAAYDEFYRMLDFDGYKHSSIAPDSGWAQKDITQDDIDSYKSVTMQIDDIGEHAGYNFVLTPKLNNADYYGGLYYNFRIRLGYASGESIGDVANMDIPIEYVASLDGSWRIALAVWIPTFGKTGGWGLFTSRMTIEQYFATGGSGTELRQIYPDLATNPYVAGLISDYVTANDGFVTMNVVPIIIKNIGYTYINGKFALRAVTGVTETYCMPSGNSEIPFVCGNPPTPIWYKVSYDYTGNMRNCYVENTDQDKSHTFGYNFKIINHNTNTVLSDITARVTLAPLEKKLIGQGPSQAGFEVTLTITSQDGIEL